VTRDELRLCLDDPNVQAFLQVIRAGEGTSDLDGYRRMFGGALFDSFRDHPRQLHTCQTRHGPLSSTAAGAYQFLSRTWTALVDQYGFEDFSRQNQDEAAVALIDGRGALQDVIGGRFSEAIRKCCKEWASLPGAGYNQPERTFAQALEVYASNGGRIA
jgi:muramidase (phage lysozyme)